MNLMNDNFRGAYLTTEAAVSYYNMKHSTNDKIFIRPTVDRILLMVGSREIIKKKNFFGKTKTFLWFSFQPMCIYFRKHSCLTDAFDEQINLYTDSGLMNNWVSQFSQKKYLRFHSTIDNQRSHQKLQLTQFGGTFLLCSGMIFATTLVFLLELFSKRISIIRKIMDILQWYTTHTIYYEQLSSFVTMLQIVAYGTKLPLWRDVLCNSGAKKLEKKRTDFWFLMLQIRLGVLNRKSC